MNITHKPKTVAISLTLLNDGRLSLADKGLYAYLCGVMNGKSISLSDIQDGNNNGVQSVKTSLLKLKECGYVRYNSKEDRLTLDGNPELIVKAVRKQAPKKTEKRSREWYLSQIKTKTAQFKEYTREAAIHLNGSKSSPVKIDPRMLQEFIDWWTEYDVAKPEKGLRYEEKRTFHHGRRLTTWWKRNQKESEKKKGDRL